MIAREILEDSSESEIVSGNEHSEDDEEIWRKRTRSCQRPSYLMMISSIVKLELRHSVVRCSDNYCHE